MMFRPCSPPTGMRGGWKKNQKVTNNWRFQSIYKDKTDTVEGMLSEIKGIMKDNVAELKEEIAELKEEMRASKLAGI